MAETAKDLIYLAKSYTNYSGLELPEVDQYGATFLKPLLRIGTSTNKVKIGTVGIPLFQIQATCALTDAATSVEPVLFNTVMTGAGQVGGRVRVNLETNVALGAWANAFKASVDCKTNGRATGLLSVGCLELTMPASAPGAGTFSLLELEAVCPASWTGTNNVAMAFLNSSGATAANFDTYGLMLYLGAGFTAGAGKFLSLTSQTLKCLVGTSSRYMVLSQLEDGVGLGVSATPMVMTAAADRALAIYTTCSLTSGDARSVTINGVRTGIGGVGQIVHVNLETNVALGGYATALYATVDCKTAGKATGLISAIAGDMTLPASNPGAGSYCIYEANFICPASWTGTNYLSIMNINASGATVATFDTAGLLFDITGVTIASTKFVQANTATAATHAIKCRINGTLYYVMLTNVGA